MLKLHLAPLALTVIIRHGCVSVGTLKDAASRARSAPISTPSLPQMSHQEEDQPWPCMVLVHRQHSKTLDFMNERAYISRRVLIGRLRLGVHSSGDL
jgi:hypothetical protein